MKILLFLSMGTALAASPFQEQRLGQFKGAILVSQQITDALFEAERPFEIRHYVNNDRSLEELLGRYRSIQGKSTFVNGDPNGVNLLIYVVALGRLSKDLARICGSKMPDFGKARLNGYFLDLMTRLCVDLNEPDLEMLWYALMGYEAPIEELEIWKKFSKTEEVKKNLDALFLSLLLNPHFLLVK